MDYKLDMLPVFKEKVKNFGIAEKRKIKRFMDEFANGGFKANAPIGTHRMSKCLGVRLNAASSRTNHKKTPVSKRFFCAINVLRH